MGDSVDVRIEVGKQISFKTNPGIEKLGIRSVSVAANSWSIWNYKIVVRNSKPATCELRVFLSTKFVLHVDA
jgi:hypothetical protein